MSSSAIERRAKNQFRRLREPPNSRRRIRVTWHGSQRKTELRGDRKLLTGGGGGGEGARAGRCS